MLDHLHEGWIYSKTNLCAGYNNICIKEGDKWKTALHTCYSLYEYLIMPFSLINTPATFQCFMNDIFYDMVDSYVVVYLNNILIYSASLDEHCGHVHSVLQMALQQQPPCEP